MPDPFFGRTRRMLVSTNNGAVDERLLEIRILRQMSEDAMPYASPRPTGKALIDAVPRTDLPGKIAPRATGAGNPQHRLDEQLVVGCGPARIAGLAPQQRGYPFKLIVTQPHSTHPDSAQKSGYDHKLYPVNRGLATQSIERKRLFPSLNPMAFRQGNECQQTLAPTSTFHNACREQRSFGLAYITKLDPMWNDDELTFIFNPDGALLGNIAARAACASDCVLATAGSSGRL